MSQRTVDGDAGCPCGSDACFGACCGRLHAGEAVARTAEALMRSRYSAFVIGDEAYLLETWHPETRPSRVRLDPGQRWLGLKIKVVEDGGLDDERGIVEFVARAKTGGKAIRLHECSRFERISGRWYYRDGDHLG